MSTPTPSDPPPPYDDAHRPAHRPSGPVQAPSLNAPGPQGPHDHPLRSTRGPPPLKKPLPLSLPALDLLRGKRVILASKSPRRRHLLAQLGLTNLDIVPSDFAEDLSKSLSPLEYVLGTATEKARQVYIQEIDNTEKGEPALILAADTIIISHGGEILEKPRSEVDHIQMLQMLRDEGTHKVVTAVAVMAPLETAVDPGYKMETHIEVTTVKFDANVTDELILAYVKTRDGADKAGGYGIQSGGGVLIEKIDGSYDNVIGLPLRATLNLIEKVMIPEEADDDEMDNMFNLTGSDDEDTI